MTWEEIAAGIAAAKSAVRSATAALTGKLAAAGIVPAEDTLSAAIDALPETLIVPRVVNAGAIAPTGTYATATYYNTDFGVRIAYDAGGDIYIIMKGGTTTSYEYLRFAAASVPEGVTVEATVPTSSSYVSMTAGMMQVGVIHGVTGNVRISLVMDAINSTYDYTDVKVTVEAA